MHQLVQASDKELKGEDDDRINFLLLGVGGPGHEGPELSDTIIFVSVRPSDGSVGTLTIPRDLVVPIPGYGWRKINHINAFAENTEPGSGPILAAQVIGDLLEQDINYYMKVNFDGFAEFIDALGGLSVDVETAFTDARYPSHGKELSNCSTENEEAVDDSNDYGFLVDADQSDDTEDEIDIEKPNVPQNYSCRFEVLSFEQGVSKMDGDTALKYVRSRYGNNGESSDFSRSRRQQNIILAVKKKILSVPTLLNPAKLTRIFGALQKNIVTNITVREGLRIAETVRDVNRDEVAHHVLDLSNGSPLYETFINGAYVLLPKNDNWDSIKKIAYNIFETDKTIQTITKYTSDPTNRVRIEIQNGTKVSGLASRTAQAIDGQNIEVVKVGNSSTQAQAKTVIYDLSEGMYSDELQSLRTYLNADVSMTASGWIFTNEVIPNQITLLDDPEELTSTQNIDFLIILGEDAASQQQSL